MRRRFRKERNRLTSTQRQEGSSRVCQLLDTLVKEYNPKVLHTFIPLPEEVDILPFIGTILRTDITIVVSEALEPPRLRHWVLNDLGSLRFGRFNTRYPDNAQPFTDHADLIIVPGLAFDHCGHRLGYGDGYYDAFLKGTLAIKIGVGFPFQLFDEILPTEEHDMTVDYVLTDRRFRRQIC